MLALLNLRNRGWNKPAPLLHTGKKIELLSLLCKPHAEYTTQIIIQMSAITNSVLVYL